MKAFSESWEISNDEQYKFRREDMTQLWAAWWGLRDRDKRWESATHKNISRIGRRPEIFGCKNRMLTHILRIQDIQKKIPQAMRSVPAQHSIHAPHFVQLGFLLIITFV